MVHYKSLPKTEIQDDAYEKQTSEGLCQWEITNELYEEDFIDQNDERARNLLLSYFGER